ncbi:MAG: four helix bundle protein [Sphingobacterium sp.]|jgi:four helix bundle protein|uniref:four helix bundle protein n=1 Tax=unclassified Sphingobacterium TaxID=2609468 RepID=UPI000984F057|nr:four helix bundle protein [Sphingobacterium sp. CZ-UAM]MDF2518670.1 four helix bundle protein [Sphingobacterium sp.]OOG17414.1 four helix bundle protein [Sphingobacterium sp. CZ-UAM]
MHNYKELILWQKSITLVSDVYRATSIFPDRERFNLISQINRAAVSIPSNIAEGAGRNSDKEFVQFLAIAHASTYEVETQLIISKNLGYLSEEDLEGLLEKLEELQKMNYIFQQKLLLKVKNLTTNI